MSVVQISRIIRRERREKGRREREKGTFLINRAESGAGATVRTRFTGHKWPRERCGDSIVLRNSFRERATSATVTQGDKNLLPSKLTRLLEFPSLSLVCPL